MSVAARLPRERQAFLAPTRAASTTALTLIANGRASGFSPAVVREAERALRAAGAAVEVEVTRSLDDLAAVLGTRPRRVVSLGGDGSLHALANLRGHRPEIAVLPAGGANNIAAALGVPSDLHAAARLAVAGSTRVIDAVAVSAGGDPYLALEGVSIGFLARARARYRGDNSGDAIAGLRAGLAELRRWEPFKVTISTDRGVERVETTQIFVANLRRYAFGLDVAPAAVPDDGQLDVVAIGARGRADLLSLLRHLRRGTHLGLPRVRTWRATYAYVDAGGASPVVADSAILGAGTAALSVRRDALRVVAP